MLRIIYNYLKKIVKIISPYKKDNFSKLINYDDKILITKIIGRKLTYLSQQKLIKLANTCRLIEKQGLPGIFIEAGCALGGSSILISKIKNFERSFFIYDIFDMIPPPTHNDMQDAHDRYFTIITGNSKGIGNNIYYGYEENLYESVISNFRSVGIDCEIYNIKLIKGFIQETMQIDQPVAFAHIDVDWYEPTMTCLEQIYPNLVNGGSIIIDDYFCWGGSKKAVDEYFQKISTKLRYDKSERTLKVTKI